MHPLRVLAFLLALVPIFFGVKGIKDGIVTVRARTYERTTQPFGFWSGVLSLFFFGAVLLYFAFFGKIKG